MHREGVGAGKPLTQPQSYAHSYREAVLWNSTCYDLKVSPPLPSPYVEILVRKTMAFGGGALGRKLGHEGKALLSENPGRYPVPSSM